MTGEQREVLNLSSYNYLGFAQSHGPCADAVEMYLLLIIGISKSDSRYGESLTKGKANLSKVSSKIRNLDMLAARRVRHTRSAH
jgi:7-keto-8-aminopelargonate synthetase-like enzyme